MKTNDRHHKDILKHVCENLDQNLDSPECRRIKKHLERCPSCAAYLDSLKKTVSLYKHQSSPTLPEEVRTQLGKLLKLRS